MKRVLRISTIVFMAAFISPPTQVWAADSESENPKCAKLVTEVSEAHLLGYGKQAAKKTFVKKWTKRMLKWVGVPALLYANFGVFPNRTINDLATFEGNARYRLGDWVKKLGADSFGNNIQLKAGDSSSRVISYRLLNKQRSLGMATAWASSLIYNLLPYESELAAIEFAHADLDTLLRQVSEIQKGNGQGLFSRTENPYSMKFSAIHARYREITTRRQQMDVLLKAGLKALEAHAEERWFNSNGASIVMHLIPGEVLMDFFPEADWVQKTSNVVPLETFLYSLGNEWKEKDLRSPFDSAQRMEFRQFFRKMVEAEREKKFDPWVLDSLWAQWAGLQYSQAPRMTVAERVEYFKAAFLQNLELPADRDVFERFLKTRSSSAADMFWDDGLTNPEQEELFQAIRKLVPPML